MNIDRYVCKLESHSIDYRLDVDLSAYCSYGTGGKTRVAVFPKNAEQLKLSLDEEIDCEVVGCGTNVLFSDKGYDGAIIFTSQVNAIECNGLSIIADCGALLKNVAETAAMNSLGGLEFTEGIPATVGGAVCMNAGCFSKCVGDYVSYVVTAGGVISGADCDFGYRTSIFSEHNGESGIERNKRIIVSACFILKPSECDVIDGKRERFKKLRKNAQPHGKSCGSVFLNDGYFAGKVIDCAGLKGVSIGGARVSEKHANFILAGGGATSGDIYSLINLIKKRVYETQGIMLKEEIRYIGNFDD